MVPLRSCRWLFPELDNNPVRLRAGTSPQWVERIVRGGVQVCESRLSRIGSVAGC